MLKSVPDLSPTLWEGKARKIAMALRDPGSSRDTKTGASGRSTYYHDGGGKHDLPHFVITGKAATPLAGQGLKILVILRSMFSCFFPFSDPIHGY